MLNDIIISMKCLFCEIANNKISSFKVWENGKFFAFLDISPLAKGHTLVVPKLQNDYIFDLQDDLLAEMIVFSKKIAKI